MKKRTWIWTAAAVAAMAGAAYFPQNAGRQAGGSMPGGGSFRILFGVGDERPTVWDGTVVASGGKIQRIQGWQFAGTDSTDGVSSWKASTRASVGRKKRAGPQVENGVIITVAEDDPGMRLDIKTAQGAFSFLGRDIVFGAQKPFLGGRVLVDRVPVAYQLTTSAEEQDFPAIAQSEDDVFVSYVEFVHSNRALELRRSFERPPENFDFLARPAGGDQVFLVRYSKSARSWGAPMAVSEPKQDIMRTAVAVDGSKRVWVFWSANREGNFDLYARSYSGGRWSKEIRLTSDAGTDLNPVAATDSQGRVWVAWQGFRNGNLEILATAQSGDRFLPEVLVSVSRASDWDPAIAAAPNGDVAISWDTYDKGDYDVYFRRMRLDNGIRMDPPVPVAASPNFEARSSVAFDSASRLWVAYEASDTKWGNDFGAYETTGVALYQDHNLKVRCYQGTQPMETRGSLEARLPGKETGSYVWLRALKKRSAQRVSHSLPDPELAREPGNASPHPSPFPLNAFPRLAVDPSGVVYLAFRTPVLGQSPVGTVWVQNLLVYEGSEWKNPIAVPQSDYWLDARPAMAVLAPGHLMMVAPSDHRRSPSAQGARARMQNAGNPETLIQSDLIVSEFRFGTAAQTAELKPASATTPGKPDPETMAEREQIALMRNYRAEVGGVSLRLLRGEFHRHTEMSGDGGRDGPLIDAYRYLIDAAAMDWGGCCDHDNGGGREYSWWIQQKLTDAYKLGSAFIPMFSYERSVRFPEGHRNVVFARRGIRPLPRLPKMADDSPPAPAPDTQMLYRYLRRFEGIAASHTSATGMGTDWRDNDPLVEPVVEIYQGDRQNYEMPGAPRSLTVPPSHPGFVSLALQKGYRLGFQSSSDHISTHMSYCNLWVTAPTREAIMEAFHKRRVYGGTDNILADVRCGEHFMGEEFPVEAPPAISVKLWGTAPFAKVQIVKDGQYVYTVQPNQKIVSFTWRDGAAQKGKTSYYYVRGEQQDGELVWVSPMWIQYR